MDWDFEMLKIGLTGGIGSGKTTIADRFAAHGVAVIDTDLIAHRLTAAGGAAMPAIQARFGADFVTADGALDRARMRALVFSDPVQRAALEAITHPLIRSACEQEMAAAQGPYLILVVPLLIESGIWQQRVDRVLVVDCDENRQIERVMRRNGFSREQVVAIIAQQATRAARLAAAHDVILNNDDAPEPALQQVDRLHRQYLQLASDASNAKRVAKTSPKR